MGPLRRGLSGHPGKAQVARFARERAEPIKRRTLRIPVTVSAVLPTSALADACATIRPDWNGTPVTAVQEALFLFATPISLILILATLIVLRLRHQWGGLAVVVGWTGALTLLTMLDPTGQRPEAAAEGCVGSATLFIIAVAAICGATILYTAPKGDGAQTPD